MGDEHAKLMEAYYAGMVPLEVYGKEQSRITEQTTYSKDELAKASQGFDDVTAKLDLALDLMQNMPQTYLEASKPLRRKLNQALFSGVFVDIEYEVSTQKGELNEPFASIVALAGRPQSKRKQKSAVEPKNQAESLVRGERSFFDKDGSKENKMVGLCLRLQNFSTATELGKLYHLLQNLSDSTAAPGVMPVKGRQRSIALRTLNVKKLVADYREVKSTRKVAELHGIGRKKATELLKKARVLLPPGRPKSVR